MNSKLFLWIAFTFALPFAKCISISSNGNSPERKILSISSKDIEYGGFVPIAPNRQQPVNYNQPKLQLNSSVLPVNERYRRLIPYMTFYLANNFNDLQNDEYAKLQKIAIPNNVPQRTQNGKIAAQYANVPHYQGNRLSQFNIASAYPSRILQDYYYPQSTIQYTPNQNPLISDSFTPIQSIMKAPPKQNIYENYKPIPIPVRISPNNMYNFGEVPNINLFNTPIEKPQQYKLVPYEQTPPVQVQEVNEDYFVPKVNPYLKMNKAPIPVPVSISSNNKHHYNGHKDEHLINYEHKYGSVFPDTISHVDNSINITPEPKNVLDYQTIKKFNYKKPVENIYPIAESGFKPIIRAQIPTPVNKLSVVTSSPYVSIGNKPVTTTQNPQFEHRIITTLAPSSNHVENIEIDEPVNVNYGISSSDQFEQNNLANILKSLQSSNSLPQTITTENIDSSIKTLVKILKDLKTPKYQEVTTTRPMVSSPVPFQATPKPKTITNAHSMIQSRNKQPHKSLQIPKIGIKPIHDNPPQDLDVEHVVEPPIIQEIGHTQSFPPDYYEHGGTPGRIGVDYPALSTIPATSFDCKTQRYKGFFGDPETNCQVWHYCDLNGGQASFLCPNGTIFSQVALTCDWWFNVKCSTTTQLYVLNERLYKYILPFSPKFPEDYSGPLVDKYLAIKFKEMEEKMKKKKKGTKPEPELETEKADVIEIKTSGMSGALRPYDN